RVRNAHSRFRPADVAGIPSDPVLLADMGLKESLAQKPPLWPAEVYLDLFEPSLHEIKPILAPEHLLAHEKHRHSEDPACGGCLHDRAKLVADFQGVGCLENGIGFEALGKEQGADDLGVGDILVALPVGAEHGLRE